MMDDHTNIMFNYISGSLHPGTASQFESDLKSDSQLKQEWHSFLVEQYLDGRLNEEWKSRFKNELQTNRKLNEELTLQNSVRSDLPDSLNNVLREEVKSILPRRPYDKNRSRNRIRRIYIMAAAAVLVILLLFIPHHHDTVQYLPDIYVDQFEKYDMLLTYRSGSSQSVSLQSGIEAYENDDFQSALDNFIEALSENESPELITLYAGISAVGAKKFDRAIRLFQNISQESPAYEQAQWYSALAYLAQDDQLNSEKLLEQIVNSESFYSERARRILARIQ